MLDRLPTERDKREGALIWYAVASAAIEFKNLYNELDVFWTEAFADTASREYLIRRAKERGLIPYPATACVVQADLVGADVPINTRFNCGDFNYYVIAKNEDGTYQLQCETVGSAPNSVYGTLTPIDFVPGLESAELTELLTPGEDEEDTETFRQRYLDSFYAEAFGGNIADYKEKVGAMQGVGGVKVFPAWKGPGTVRVLFTTSEYKVPSAELVQTVQTAVDPETNHGEGLGTAPIGHTVTVEGVKSKNIDVGLHLTFQEGWNWESVLDSVNTTIDTYLNSLSQEWADSETLVVRINQLEALLLNVNGILDLSNTTINGGTVNLEIEGEYIPVRGTVTNS